MMEEIAGDTLLGPIPRCHVCSVPLASETKLGQRQTPSSAFKGALQCQSLKHVSLAFSIMSSLARKVRPIVISDTDCSSGVELVNEESLAGNNPTAFKQAMIMKTHRCANAQSVCSLLIMAVISHATGCLNLTRRSMSVLVTGPKRV